MFQIWFFPSITTISVLGLWFQQLPFNLEKLYQCFEHGSSLYLIKEWLRTISFEVPFFSFRAYLCTSGASKRQEVPSYSSGGTYTKTNCFREPPPFIINYWAVLVFAILRGCKFEGEELWTNHRHSGSVQSLWNRLRLLAERAERWGLRGCFSKWHQYRRGRCRRYRSEWISRRWTWESPVKVRFGSSPKLWNRPTGLVPM